MRIAIVLLIIGLLILLGFQNCGDVRLKGFDNPPPPTDPPVLPPPPPPPPPVSTPPGEGTPAPVPEKPTVTDGGNTSGRTKLGLSTMYPAFVSVEWAPTGHFLVVGPCSPINKVGQNGWPGGQYLFDANGNFVTMGHVCRDSGYSEGCPEPGGCQLGDNTIFVNNDTFVRFAQAATVGRQRAPMLYKIQNNRFIFLGQLFTPRYNSLNQETYPADYWAEFGTVVNNTLVVLKERYEKSPIPNSYTTPNYEYRMSLYSVNTALGTTSPFEPLLEFPDRSPQTLRPIHSVGPFVISKMNVPFGAPAKVYRANGNSFTFVKDLVSPGGANLIGDNWVAKDSLDPNTFYLRPLSNLRTLHKYRYQNDTIEDLGAIPVNSNENIIMAAQNIVLKIIRFDSDTGDCPQRSEVIVEVNGERVPLPTLTYDHNEFANEFCALRPNGRGCDTYEPLPVPGRQCRSEPITAAVNPNGVLMYIERFTERTRILKIR